MKYKNAALAVLFTASLAVAVQDFGVPSGVPNVFIAGETAVADDVNANFEWVENALSDQAILDDILDERIDDLVLADDAQDVRIDDLVLADDALDELIDGLVLADDAQDVRIDDLVLADDAQDVRIDDLVLADDALDVRIDDLVLADDALGVRIDDLVLADDALNVRIDEVEANLNQRVQTLTALGYVDSSGWGGPLPEGNAVRGGISSDFWGYLHIPVPQDWDPSTDMTVTVGLLNVVDGEQTGQDVEIDLFGDWIFSGSSAVFDEDDGPFCRPGPVCGSEFNANCFISVPTVSGGGPLLNDEALGSDVPYLVTATFTIDAPVGVIGIGLPTQMRINIFEPSSPLITGGGEPDPHIVLLPVSWANPFSAPSYVSLEYTAF